MTPEGLSAETAAEIVFDMAVLTSSKSVLSCVVFKNSTISL